MSNTVDVQEIMRDIRSGLSDRAAPPALPVLALRPNVEPDWARLEASRLALEQARSQVGQLPPQPENLRGRVGAFLIKVVQRALFWLTPQLREVHEAVARFLGDLVPAAKTLAEDGQERRTVVDALNRRLAELGAEVERLKVTLGTQRKAIQTTIKFELAPELQARRALESRFDSLTLELEGVTRSLRTDAQALDEEVATRTSLGELLMIETSARERIERAFETETAARQDLERRIAAEVAARSALLDALARETESREEIARRLASETAARDSFAHRVQTEVASLAALQTLQAQVDAVVASLAAEREALAGESGARQEIARQVAVETASRETLARELESLTDHHRRTETHLTQLRSELISQARRITILIEEARKRLPAPFDEKHAANLVDQEKHSLDGLYVSFEDTFRGTRADIKDRCRVYLPYLKEQGIGTQAMPVLDVGCGRGEWLELLRDNQLQGRGIDLNSVLLAYCEEAGLNVSQDDILEHLKNQPDCSLGAVTGFHIIEHLPFQTLVRVFDETVRVLKPGGLAIFETPNPQNILVGAHNFWVDFTHRNPLPSVTTQFLLEARGLCDVRVLGLHPYPDSLRLQDERTEVAKRFNQFFYGPQDYAVIGRKA